MTDSLKNRHKQIFYVRAVQGGIYSSELSRAIQRKLKEKKLIHLLLPPLCIQACACISVESARFVPVCVVSF